MEQKKYRSYALHNFRQIKQLTAVDEYGLRAMEVVGNVLPFKTNNYVTDELIDWSNWKEDPMFLLTFPQREMLSRADYDIMSTTLDRTNDKFQVKRVADKIRHSLNPHPAGQIEKNIPEIAGKRLQGLQHKYKETVLFFPAQGQTCHAYCTFCFRWPQFTGMEEMKFAMRETSELAEYLHKNPSVTDVLFTGGDPMIMKTKVFETYISGLLTNRPENLQTIRIGTKALAYWPYRFTEDDDADELIRLFEKTVKSGIHLSLMAHFSHPVELSTPAVVKAISRLRSVGVVIRTQSPVLRGINDQSSVWADMWRRQVALGCVPYYMFLPRDTGAKDFFDVSLEKAWTIFRDAYKQVSGICRTVRGPSMSCTPGKVQILGVSRIKGEKVFVLRMLQGRNPDWVARPFFAEYDSSASWFDDLKPAFGDEKFFFEMEQDKILQDFK